MFESWNGLLFEVTNKSSICHSKALVFLLRLISSLMSENKNSRKEQASKNTNWLAWLVGFTGELPETNSKETETVTNPWIRPNNDRFYASFDSALVLGDSPVKPNQSSQSIGVFWSKFFLECLVPKGCRKNESVQTTYNDNDLTPWSLKMGNKSVVPVEFIIFSPPYYKVRSFSVSKNVLCLAGTIGDKEKWNDRRQLQGFLC